MYCDSKLSDRSKLCVKCYDLVLKGHQKFIKIIEWRNFRFGGSIRQDSLLVKKETAAWERSLSSLGSLIRGPNNFQSLGDTQINVTKDVIVICLHWSLSKSFLEIIKLDFLIKDAFGIKLN